MACFNPLEGWHSRNCNPSGKYPVTFRMRDGWVDKPISLSCGKCPGCLADKSRAWGVRCYHESQQHFRNSFLTLTYGDTCPEKLQVKHLQDFFKRLRARKFKLRYFACGEYGGKFGRPHYHALIFGEDFKLDGQPLGSDGYYTSKTLEQAWPHGFHTLAPVEPASVFYVAGYQLKNLDKPDTFHVASKRPYIGAGWLSKYHDDIVRNGFVTIDGQKHPVPPSYLLRPEFAFEFDALKDSRREYVRSLPPETADLRRAAARNRERNLIARAYLK